MLIKNAQGHERFNNDGKEKADLDENALPKFRVAKYSAEDKRNHILPISIITIMLML